MGCLWSKAQSGFNEVHERHETREGRPGGFMYIETARRVEGFGTYCMNLTIKHAWKERTRTDKYCDQYTVSRHDHPVRLDRSDQTYMKTYRYLLHIWKVFSVRTA